MVLLLAAAVLVFPVTGIAGQDPAAPRLPGMSGRYIDPAAGHSLQDLVALGVGQEPGLQAALLATTAARHEVRQAGLRANPKVSVERRQEVGGMDRQWTGMVEWPLELFRRGARVATAEAEVAIAAASAADRQRMLALEIERQYGRLLAAVRSVAVLDDLAAAARDTVTLLGQRAEAGAAPRIDRDAAAVEAGRLEAQRAMAGGQADAAMLELKRLVGLPPDAPLTLRETLDQAIARQPPDQEVRLDVHARPDVQEAVGQTAVEEARIAQLRREGRFDLALFGGYMRMDAGFPQQGFGTGGELEPIRGVFHNAVMGANVMVPLFNRNQGAIAAAQARRTAAARTADARRLQASTEVAAAAARLRAARASLAVFTGTLRETARRNLDVVRESYQLGRNTVLDVLAEQRRSLELEMAYGDALAEAFEAQADLRAARGEQR